LTLPLLTLGLPFKQAIDNLHRNNPSVANFVACFLAEISEHHELLSHFSSTIDESVAGHEHADNLSVVDSCDIDDVMLSDVSDGDCDSDNCLYDGIVTVLHKWAVKYSVRRNVMSQLLVIVREHFPELPKDARTFLPTVNDVEMDTVKLVSKRSYYHFDVENGICSVLESHDFDQLKCASEVSLQVNVDGLPLFKSTNGQFWPVLGKLELPFVSDPFVIGMFYSEKKPNSLHFLADFVGECKNAEAVWHSVQGPRATVQYPCNSL